MILVLDAYGRIGSAVVRHLASHGHRVRAFVTTRSRLSRIESAGAEVTIGSLTDPHSLYTAMAGIDTLVLISPATADDVALEMHAIEAASRAGVTRIVKLSSVDAEPHTPNALARAHWDVEQRLERGGIPAVVVRSNRLMQTIEAQVSLLLHAGVITGCQHDARVSDVDARDVAAVLATLAGNEARGVPAPVKRVGNVSYLTLTGPQALTRAEVAGLLTEPFGRFVSYIDCTPAELLQYAQAAGLSPLEARTIVSFETLARDGRFGETTDVGRAVLGRPLRDFASFAQELAVSVRYSRAPDAMSNALVS